MKNIIFRYILGELVGPLVLGILIFSGILLGSALFRASDIVLAGGLKPGHVLDLVISFIPYLVDITVPMSLLLAILLTYGKLSEHNEIIALSAGGVGYYRIFAPSLVIGVLFFGFMLYWDNIVTPAAYQFERKTLFQVLKYALPPDIRESSFNTRYKGFMLYVKKIEPKTRSFKNVAFFSLNGDKISDALFSPLGTIELDDDMHSLTFRLQGGSLHHFGEGLHTSGPFKEALFRIDIRDRIRRLTKGSDERKGFSTLQLLTEVRKTDSLIRAGQVVDDEERDLKSNSIRLRREFHNRFALPAVCLVLPWIATPLALFTRSGKKSYAFIGSIMICCGYYILTAMGKSLVLSGVLSPALGCWMAAFVLAIIGAALTPVVARK